MTTEPPTVPISYTIAGCSEHSGKYVAENIMVDNPLDQGSRWSGAYHSTNVRQWLLLKLDTLSILKTITFGKFHKPHPCNMKEFKVYVGASEENMTEVLHSGLKNDHLPETFNIQSVNQEGVTFPTTFVKIVPLNAHGQSFHTSIWYVSMSGITDETFVEQIRSHHEEFQETVILRQLLKHLRQRRLLTAYQQVLSQTNLSAPFEHPLITSLHNVLVLHGNFSESESLLSSIASQDLFSSSLLSSQPSAIWRKVEKPLDLDGDTIDGRTPSARGGHAMCMDQENGSIYLFGGWDGKNSLDDFWVFDTHTQAWNLISDGLTEPKDPSRPGPSACHKMVHDSKTGSIYLFGRLDDHISNPHASGQAQPSSSPRLAPSTSAPAGRAMTTTGTQTTGSSSRVSLPHDVYDSVFYKYHTRGENAGKWEIISMDTRDDGGPPLIFDHQMVIDSENQILYVSGGRILDTNMEPPKYSGLYSYNVKTGTWEMLLSSDPSSTHPDIPSRFGHSMVLDKSSQTLIVFGGQRQDKYLSDMYAYHIPTKTVTDLFPNFTTMGGPDACFTQRAVLDEQLKEIYVFCGLTKGPPGELSILESDRPNWIYRYERPDRPGKWMPILPPHLSSTLSQPEEIEVPLPRYAHQAVYDEKNQVVYMHGGNAGLGRDESEEQSVSGDNGTGSVDEDDKRLDDFWMLKLKRPVPEDIIRRGKYLIRQQQFREMCEDGPPIKALSYLQTEVSAVVNHNDEDETILFRSLLSHLLIPTPRKSSSLTPSTPPSNSRTSTPSRKRSRRDTSPFEENGSGPGGGSGSGGKHRMTSHENDTGTGTNTTTTADEDVAMSSTNEITESNVQSHSASSSMSSISSTSTSTSPGVKSLFTYNVDPLESVAASTSISGGTQGSSTEHHHHPSAARYKQRTEVFEQLLKFVNEDARQPERDLVNMINVDQDDRVVL
ncbi:CTLH complex component protein [Abortiporus biennis]